MITLLDRIGPAIWRASWQAALLALLVALLLRSAGDRLAPRWRFLMWGVVLTRFLIVPTPGSPWSVFNLVAWNADAPVRPIAPAESGPTLALGSPRVDQVSSGSETNPVPAPIPDATPVTGRTDILPLGRGDLRKPATSLGDRLGAVTLTRALSMTWLAGCVLLGLRLMATGMVLRRRLAACRPVTDGVILSVLERYRRRFGLARTPALLVTPGCQSPCIVGTWKPKIIVPECLVTQSSTASIRHVLAHELAHLVRGDLWTNWVLLAGRTLHWFNPVAWWTVREMQAEREAACDELAITALDETERPAYAATLVELAAGQSPYALAPGLIGLFASRGRLETRVERLLRSPNIVTLRGPVSAGLWVAVALMGLTDAMPGARAQAPKDAASTAKAKTQPRTHTISGRCVDQALKVPLSGVVVRLYRVEGLIGDPVEIDRTITDLEGRYTFTDLDPPRPENHLDRLDYGVLGFKGGRPVGIPFGHFVDGKEVVELQMTTVMSTIAGKVVDVAGKPVAGAAIMPYWFGRRPIPGLLSGTTDADGRFKLDDVGVFKWPDGSPVPVNFVVVHPDYCEKPSEAIAPAADVVVRLPAGSVVTGTATDKVTGQPGAGAIVTARRVDEWGEYLTATDASGRFRLVVPEGRYNFLAEAKNRVAIAVTGRECLAGERIELPAFALIGGGIVAGRVVNTATGEPVSVSESGGPIMLGLIGPSQPPGKAISPVRLAAVDESGRFQLRAAPGANFPYFVNTRGNRMAWDTQRQPPIVVKDGETTNYDMLITPEISPADKLKAARKLVAGLPKDPSDRAAEILREFRKLSFTVDETETWCMLMRELVAIGRDAVPQVCAELDRTVDDRALRKLAFALRAIGDARAVPALIRSIPKTLLPSSSDYGLIVNDKDLNDFMQSHDLNKQNRGRYFNLGRPVREVFGALHVLTGRDFGDSELFGVFQSDDSRRSVLKRRLFVRQARLWRTWWEANWRTFTRDDSYQKVKLMVSEDPPSSSPAAPVLGKSARLSQTLMGAVLSPVSEKSQNVQHFIDLDTGTRPGWPAHLPKDDALDAKQLADWARESGADLMCVTHRSPDGTETYVLRALGMAVREISTREMRNLDRLLGAGTPPEGRTVDELLMHYDSGSGKLVPNANATFLYVTSEGNWGVIETTDRITRTADLTGMPTRSAPSGVGFRKGVRFNLSEIAQ